MQDQMTEELKINEGSNNRRIKQKWSIKWQKKKERETEVPMTKEELKRHEACYDRTRTK